MSEVKRYELEDIGPTYHKRTEMVLSVDGCWVEYDDYAAIKAQRDALAAEFWLTRHLIPDDVATPNIKDALNAIKAEGVEILTGKLQQLIDEGVFDAKEIGVAAGAVYEGAQMAAKIRAGEPS